MEARWAAKWPPTRFLALRCRAMSETAIPLDQQLEEIRAQLAWVRDYL